MLFECTLQKKNVVELKVLDLLLAVKLEKLENLNSLSTVFPHSNDPTVKIKFIFVHWSTFKIQPALGVLQLHLQRLH